MLYKRCNNWSKIHKYINIQNKKYLKAFPKEFCKNTNFILNIGFLKYY